MYARPIPMSRRSRRAHHQLALLVGEMLLHTAPAALAPAIARVSRVLTSPASARSAATAAPSPPVTESAPGRIDTGMADMAGSTVALAAPAPVLISPRDTALSAVFAALRVSVDVFCAMFASAAGDMDAEAAEMLFEVPDRSNKNIDFQK